LRIAIVGSGYIARVHSRVATALGGEVVAVCGRTLASAAAFGVGDAYDSLPIRFFETPATIPAPQAQRRTFREEIGPY
jgi:hypothetical protein